jgi:hypothetical protein
LLGLQGFPGTAFVEQQIEETRMVFLQGDSPSQPPRL